MKCQYHLKLAREDRFYLLSVTDTRFSLKEMSREAYGNLQTTKVPYTKTGSSDSFSLMRNGRIVGHAKMAYAWKSYREEALAVLTPDRMATLTDRYALGQWALQTAMQRIGGLGPCFVEWIEPLPIRQAA